jgi:hypothetical protein
MVTTSAQPRHSPPRPRFRHIKLQSGQRRSPSKRSWQEGHSYTVRAMSRRARRRRAVSWVSVTRFPWRWRSLNAR